MRQPCDLVCLSHLRWDFVYQRPQHLMTRAARDRRVLFVEEPLFEASPGRLELTHRPGGVIVATPVLPRGLDEAAAAESQRDLIDGALERLAIDDYLLWYLTPMALPATRHLSPRAIVYDCMDELSSFRGAPAAMKAREAELLRRADLVFTGGLSLYEHKRGKHPNVHPFPSSVDTAHFGRARGLCRKPADQASIRRPRIGYAGVIDERMDLDLVAAVAELRPGYSFVFVGPTAKLDPAALPRRSNLCWLGPKPYEELPDYLAGWDVAILPFARNEATRFISPTKTPEYLAAGRPVVSTSVRDVVRPYGAEGLARIADDPAAFAAAVDEAMREDPRARQLRADARLARTSWDDTWARMAELADAAAAANGARSPLASASLADAGPEAAE